MEVTNRPTRTATNPSIRSRVWRGFHAWTLATIGILTAANVYSALRPFESFYQNPDSNQALIRIAGKSSSQTREPAASTGAMVSARGDDHMAEVRIDCQQRLEINLSAKVQSLRLQLNDCTLARNADKAPAAITAPAYYVRNETNGFEGTVFRIPASSDRLKKDRLAKDQISTDFISLENGKNIIRISRSLDDQPSVEQWLTINRN